MATDNIDLFIGGEKVTVPAWSTESTLSSVANYSEATAKSLNAMLKAQGKQGKVSAGNTKLFNNILSAQNTTATAVVDSIKNDKKASKRMETALEKDIKARAKGFTDTFNKQDLEGMTKAIAGAGMVGIAAGLAVGTLVQFSKDLTEMSHIGVGFGDTLLELKGYATDTGLDLSSYGKLIAGNMGSMIALGGTVHEGAREFSALSKEVRAAAQDYHNFGLTNTEMNQVIADEIELRRKSGMQQSLIANSVANSMNNLMLETSALANITGQDRREVMRARNESMNDEVTAAFVGTLDEIAQNNAFSMASTLKPLGAAGETIYKSIIDSMASGLDADVVNSGELGKLAALSPEIGKLISGIDNFAKNNINNQNSSEFESELVARVAGLQNAINGDERVRLSILATTSGAQADNARALLGLVNATQGLNTSADENRTEYDRTTIATMQSDLIGLSSSLETTVNTLKTAALESTIGAFDTFAAKLMGESDLIGKAGSGMVSALNSITSAYTDTGLAGGSVKLLKDIDKSTLLMVAAAGALLTFLKGNNGRNADGNVGGGILNGILGGSLVIGAKNMLSRVSRQTPDTPRSTPRVSTPPSAPRSNNSITKGTGPLAAIVGGLFGATDDEYQAAGMHLGERIEAGIMEGMMAGIVDFPVNLGSDLINEFFGTDLGKIDMSGASRTSSLNEEKYENRNSPPPTVISNFDPTQSMEHFVPDKLNGTTGAHTDSSGAMETNMTAENAWRHGERGQQFLEELQRQQSNDAKETNHLIRKLITAVENN
jgi:hypothetical protein